MLRERLTHRIARALMGLGLIGAVITMTTGLSGIVGTVLMIALLDGFISLCLWFWRRVQRFLPHR